MGAAVQKLDFLTGDAVDGETLADRLSRGRLSVEEGLRHAIQIGGILNSAHSQGKFHGCLSPACILLTDAGPRLLRPENTLAVRPEYRSPEQVRGEPPDCNSDIFTFGALLHEMITGRPAFGGAGEELDRAILESDPWTGGGFPVPALLQVTIASLMAKDKARRRQRIQNAVIELKLRAISFSGKAPVPRLLPREGGAQESRPSMWMWSRRFAAAAIVLFALATSAVAAVLLFDWRPSLPVFKFTVAAPEEAMYIGGAALSPDGRQLVFSGLAPDGKRMLWLRMLDALHAAAIPGTEGGAEPFWSPDGQSIGFFANGSLQRVGVGGETPTTICSTEALAGGGAWNRRGTMLFAPGFGGGLYTVPAGGGSPRRLLDLDSGKRERSFLWPEFLPDGTHFVFFDQTGMAESTGVYVGSLDGTDRRMLFRSESNAVFAGMGGGESNASGYLLFLREGNLFAQALDLSRLRMQGEPVILANDIDTLTSLSLIPVAASHTGVLAYQSVGKRTRQLVWMDETGEPLGTAGSGDYGIPRLAPDGTVIADAGRVEDGTALSPDGKWLAYRANESGVTEIYVQPFEGSQARVAGRRQVSSGGGRLPRWSRDGAGLYYMTPDGSVMSAALHVAGSDPQFTSPRVLFRTRQLPNSGNSFDVSRDGQRLIVNLPLEDATSSPITVVTNWTGKFKN